MKILCFYCRTGPQKKHGPALTDLFLTSSMFVPLHQLQIEPPQMAGIIALDIGAQQIAAFAPPRLPGSLPVQREVECFGCDWLTIFVGVWITSSV